MDPILVAGAPLVLGLIQALHPVIPDRWRPIASVICGWIVAVIFASSGQVAWTDTPLAGLMVGLAASGLHSGARTTIGAR